MRFLALCLLLSGCAVPTFQSYPPPEPVKHVPTRVAPPQTKVVQVAGPLMATATFNAISPVELPPDTNAVLWVPFSWGHTGVVTIQYYKLYIGPSPGVYTTSIITGATNGYEFCTTNWIEGAAMHFYAVTAVDVLGRESPFSNEVFYPPYPPTRYRLTWTNPNPATIVGTDDLSVPRSQWIKIVQTTQGVLIYTAPLQPDQQFFDLYRSTGPPDRLNIEAYNPLNE